MHLSKNMKMRTPTPAEWRAARRRWEGDPRPGHAWLAKELAAAFDLQVSRQAVAKRAVAESWAKGSEPSSPLRSPHEARSGRKAVRARVAAAAQSSLLPPQDAAAALQQQASRSKYRPGAEQRVLAWFDKPAWEDVRVERLSGLVELERVPVPPPMLAGFAKSEGVAVSTARRWATAVGPDGELLHPEFGEALRFALQLQEANIVAAGLLGLYDARTVGLVLKNLHGWQDVPAEDRSAHAVAPETIAALIRAMEGAHVRMARVLAERSARGSQKAMRSV